MPLTRTLAPLALAAALAAPAPAIAQAQSPLAQVASHLRGLETMGADFVQTSASGAVARGRLTLARPGRVRFQYEPSVPLLVVANGRTLSMVDYEVGQVSRWPIRGTPLAVLLDPTVELARYARVLPASDQAALPGFVTVRARDPKHPEYGTITLYFARGSGPAGLVLSAWRVLDAQGNTTQVQLSNVRFGVPAPASLFTYRDPRGAGTRRGAPGRG